MLHARLQRAEAAPAARKFLLFSTSMVNKPCDAQALSREPPTLHAVGEQHDSNPPSL
jgi:hypothetical protein